MNETKQFIEDAIAGGCPLPESFRRNPTDTVAGLVLLDSLAWKAVGKTRGWGKLACKVCDKDTQHSKEWLEKSDSEEYIFPYLPCICGSNKRDYRKGVKQHFDLFYKNIFNQKTIEESLIAIK